MHKRKIFIISLLALFLALISFVFINVVVEPAVAVGTVDSVVRVNKTGFGTVYLTGQDALLTKEESSYSEYSIKNGTEVTLNVVNESKLFANWNITDTKGTVINTSGVNKIKLTVNSDLIVNQVYNDPTKDDYGKYMGNSFVISSSKDLISIQRIIDYGTSTPNQEIIEEYNNLFSSYSNYKDASNKSDYITSNNLFARVYEGYYYVQHNISIFGSEFTGIGNASFPFQGVLCGLNSGKESQIVMLINKEEESDSSYYGLFGYLGDKAVVRNLKVNGSIGITATTNNYSNQNIYAGGLAGYANEPLVYNVNTSSSIAINSKNATVYSGNVIGYMNNFGFNSLNYLQTNVSKSSNVVRTKGNISSGLVCGEASKKSYFKDLEIDASSYDMSLKGEATDYSTSISIKMGLLCGGIGKSVIENIKVIQTTPFNIHADINCGNLYIGGIVGYLDATDTINIGKISFVNNSNKVSSIRGISSGSTSKANIFTGGLFGLINGNNLKANDSFKTNISKETVDEKIIYRYNPIFTGEYDIRSIQNGRSDANANYGKCVTGGIVGKGYFDISGSSDNLSNIVVIKDGRLDVKSVQSSIASHESYLITKTGSVSKSDSEHCVTGLFTGLVSSTNSKKNLRYINLYSENVSLDATREISSLSMGDISIGLLMGHSFGVNYENVNVYINNSSLNCNSLSYEVQNTHDDTNNSYVGGLVGRFYNDQTSFTMEMKNSSLKGYNWDEGKETGNTLEISSIQNTTPGGGDYRGENYVGGLIGQLYQGSIYNCEYIGSNSDKDYVIMRAHENPDSAFCGGLIGLVKATTTYQINIQNNKVLNANIYGEETLKANSSYANPDIYVAGILGALYCHTNSSTVNIFNNKVFGSVIASVGYERTNAYAGGVSGAFTWNGSTTINLKDNMIYDCKITANVQASSYNGTQHVNAFAAGICPSFRSVKVYVNNNSVMDTKINAISSKNAFVFGVVGRDNNVGAGTLIDSGSMYVNYNYSNARLSSTSGTSNHYGIYKSANSQSYNYYSKENALISTSSQSGTQLELSKPVKVTSAAVNLLENHNLTLSSNEKKYHLKLVDGAMSQFEVLDNYKVRYKGSKNTTENVEVWINTNSNNVSSFDDNLSIDEFHNLGWFLFGTMTIYNDTISSSHVCNITKRELTYIGENKEYKFDGEKFVNIKNPSDVKDNINYIQEINNNKYIITAKIYDNILNIKFKFTITRSGTNDVHNIFPHFFLDGNASEVETNDYTIGDYGKYVLSKLNVTDENVDYELIFYPNTKIEKNGVVNIKFKDGASSTYLDTELTINLEHNKRKLMGVTFADYTPPINYHMEEAKRYVNPHFLLKSNTQLVLIPVYKTINDPDNNLIIDLNYCNYVTFTLDNSSGGTMKANGDLLTGSVSDNIYTISLKDQGSDDTISLTYKIINEHQVTHDVHNMTYDGILTTSSETSYLFKLTLNNGYGGSFTSFTIKIGNTTYNLLDETNNIWSSGIIIKNKNGEQVTSPSGFSLENSYYEILLPNTFITGNIEIEASVPRVYEVSFNLQASFIKEDNRQKVFILKEGTSFRSYFSQKLSEVNAWVNEQTVYGYVFNGFYLVNDASTIASYGESFKTIYEMENMNISSNISFYARWSFLIELIEAPGTHIKTSFSDSFIQDYYNEDLLKRTIQIPINMNRGYVFTVVKDDNYIGESSVRAYSISMVDGKEVIENIIVEKYFENMNLYYISPDSIKGYLVIETSVSNSDFITGENTAVISEKIIPEDGVFTFKYVVNHRNSNDLKSYIYNSGKTDSQSNLKLEKNFILKLYKQVYNPETGLIELNDAFVQANSELEVYYQKIINGKVVKKVVGNYTIKNDNVNQVFLNDFTLLDKKTKAFENETFYNFLGNNEAVSEIYYFVLTPPNGYSTFDNRIYNIVLEGGYYDPNEDDGFVKGIRSTYEIINKPLDDLHLSELRTESSKESALYSITPSRKTSLEEINNSDTGSKKFKFTDDNTYSLLDIRILNGGIVEGQGIIYLDESKKSTYNIYSKETQFIIEKMSLKLGYGKGNVNIYASSDGVTYDLIKEINVTSVDYNLYDITEFSNGNYKYFVIDNVSSTQIRLSEIHIMPRDNGITYEFKDFKPKNHTVDMNEINLSFTQTIKNDTRHEGKSFILAVQFKDASGNIVNDIEDVHLSLENEDNEVLFDSLLEDVKGRNVVYFNLSEKLSEFQVTVPDVNMFVFSIINSKGYVLYNVQLIEIENVNKPAMGEVRYLFAY